MSGRPDSALQSRAAERKKPDDMHVDKEPAQSLRVLCVRRMGSLPVQLTPLRSLVSIHP